ncbi:NAD(P)-binding protein [Moniliophthora roreri MCA 2997]|uniref:NAD(P)-binding protein n=2 Tax=Moniliophthora roreri TaxID=221103 RepID=V2WY77_MONRO|nr:NAD(P)-binding protein [Moniliophthora roreri MCA 2997]
MGVIQSIFDQIFPPEPTWSPADIPDLTGKVILVTGGNSGLGKLTVKELLAHNAKVYLAARSKKSAEEAIKEIKDQIGKEAIFIELDLANLKSVKACAEEFSRKEKELHVLYNNAGIMQPTIEKLTAQSFDLQFGTNVLGHFYLTKLLLPILLSTANSTSDKHVRVVNVSSLAHAYFPVMNFNTFKDGPARRRYGAILSLLYSQSKLGNVIFANELARRYGDQGVVSTSLHPGAIDTNLWTSGALPGFVIHIAAFALKPPEYGVLTQLYAGTAPEAARMNGEYLIPWGRVGKATPKAHDPVLARELWNYMEEQVEDI